jgi:hypothetical protein
MATYAEFLVANGATADEVKLLDTPVGRKAFEAQQAQLAEAERLRAVADVDRKNMQDWYEKEAVPAFSKIEADAQAAKANEARAVALIKERAKTDISLAEVAKNMGWDVDTGTRIPPPNPNPSAPTFDEKKYFTRDEILTIARAEGKAIAASMRIVQEHERLFPNTAPVDWESLRQLADDTKKPLESVWMEKFNVQKARDDKAAATRQSEIDKAVDEKMKVREAELISRLGNPETRPLSTSNSPFALRPSTGRDKQPWELDERGLQADRTRRATEKAIERGVSH